MQIIQIQIQIHFFLFVQYINIHTVTLITSETHVGFISFYTYITYNNICIDLTLCNKSGVDITTTKSPQQKFPADWLTMKDQLTIHNQALCQKPPKKAPDASIINDNQHNLKVPPNKSIHSLFFLMLYIVNQW